MNLQKIILDTGPLVAYINKNDRCHEWTMAQFSTMTPPLFTCEAVLSESCFLLKDYANGPSSVLDLLKRELLTISFRLKDECSIVKALLNKYKNVPMSLTDGCLVRMAGQISDSVTFTLDNDFKIYRKNRRNVIPTITPETLHPE